MDLFTLLYPSTAAQLSRIETKLGLLVATFSEAVQAWTDYATELKTQRDAAVAALTDAQASAQTAADELAAFQADDAATDAQQLADQAQAFADQLTTALAAVQEPPAQPEPLPETPPAETPPAG